MSSPASPCPAASWAPTPGERCQGCLVAIEQLWLDRQAIGGSLPSFLLEGCLAGEVLLAGIEHDLIARALDEHLLVHGLGLPVPCLRDHPRGDGVSEPGSAATLAPSRARHRSTTARGHDISDRVGSLDGVDGACITLSARDAPALKAPRSPAPAPRAARH